MNNKNITSNNSLEALANGEKRSHIATSTRDTILELPSKSTNNVAQDKYFSFFKNKEYTSPTSVWNNSVYSFNPNYVKNVPSVDNIVNKMIRNFFSINALNNNVKGKKSRLIQRRYKRLSLNKILVSKSEIKHSNNKVFITVYLFNKRKRSLLLKINKLYKRLTMGFSKLSYNNTIWKKKSNFESISSLSSKVPGAETKIIRKNSNHLSLSNINKPTINLNIKRNSSLGFGSLSQANNTNRILSLIKKMTINKYAYMPIYYKINKLNNSSYRNLKNKIRNSKLNKATTYTFNTKMLYYSRLNNLTKFNLNKFIDSLNSSAYNLNNNFLKLAYKFFIYTNQYKLYKNDVINILEPKESNLTALHSTVSLLNPARNVKEKFLNLQESKLLDRPKNLSKHNMVSIIRFNYSIDKLRSLNKLFSLYNNINTNSENLPSKGSDHKDYIIQLYYKKSLINTYKLLKKLYKHNTKSFNKLAFKHNIDNHLNNTGLALPLNKKSKKNYNKTFKSFRSNVFKPSFMLPLNKTKMVELNPRVVSKQNSLPRKLTKINQSIDLKNLNIIILVKKLNRIDRFFKKYKNNFLGIGSINTLNNKFLKSNTSLHIINNYKINFINDLLEKELLYVYYLKLLTYNNVVFKNWFLFPLKSLLSKIYNKKVILKLVSLKYIHLNSDILSQAVDIRLRNFKKTKIVDVLKKAIKLVSISKVNIYACDEHSSMYKYIHNYYDKFKYLKLDIFKELGYLDSQSKVNSTNLKPLNNAYVPCSIRRLNNVQTSTINFIKFKSVFGVRLEAAGRLTKRSTASRALFKFRYKGTLKNNPTINNSLSTTIIKNNRISNLQYTKISSKTRNGSFGLKGWINSN